MDKCYLHIEPTTRLIIIILLRWKLDEDVLRLLQLLTILFRYVVVFLAVSTLSLVFQVKPLCKNAIGNALVNLVHMYHECYRILSFTNNKSFNENERLGLKLCL